MPATRRPARRSPGSWTCGAASRRLTESARAQYLATEEARRGVIVSLIGDVAGNYFTLRERDLELEIASHTRDIADSQPAPGPPAPRSRRGHRPRRPPGGTVSLSRHRADRQRGARHRADGERAEPAARADLPAISRAASRWMSFAPAAATAARPAIVPARTPAGHSRGRAEADLRQRADRRGQGVLLPADLAHRHSGRAEPRAHRIVHRSGALLDVIARRRSCPSSTPARSAWRCAFRRRRSAKCSSPIRRPSTPHSARCRTR